MSAIKLSEPHVLGFFLAPERSHHRLFDAWGQTSRVMAIQLGPRTEVVRVHQFTTEVNLKVLRVLKITEAVGDVFDTIAPVMLMPRAKR
jgi:hypothetical protein